MSRKLKVTRHARKRWVERVGCRIGTLEEEFKRSKKMSKSAIRSQGITIIKGRRYYLNYLCVFVIAPTHFILVTVLPRN